MKFIWAILGILAGGIIGFFAGVFIPFLGCALLDLVTLNKIGFGAVGWLLWFITIPVGTIGGAVFGLLFTLNPRRFIKNPHHLMLDGAIFKFVKYCIYALLVSLCLGFCLFHKSTAIYSYGPSRSDIQWGWPISYGYDQYDVLDPEYLFYAANFRLSAFLTDLVIGTLSGLAVVFLLYRIFSKLLKNSPNQGMDFTGKTPVGEVKD